ncbi:hypothetical protein [Acidisphaera sp. L21]|uniref:hypothetical protein n=1 Tax=Acidisphaera sp. L21 TaxID=1641851 RepID=UPI00131D3A43|nr:hypothetical protein [Acidisphaera sp. L21]
MTRAEFDAAIARKKLPLTAESKDEIFGAVDKLEAMIALVTKPRPREDEPALIFVPGSPV